MATGQFRKSEPGKDLPASFAAAAAKAGNLVEAWLRPERLERLRPQLRYQAGILAGFALAAALLLGLADLALRGVIQLRLEEDLQNSLNEVLPAALHDNDLTGDVLSLPAGDARLGGSEITFYLGKLAGKFTAASFKFTAPDGYAGPIQLVMGVSRDGDILGVRVLSHVETPGLGDKIEISKSKWVLSFDGKSLDNLTFEQWAVKKDGGAFDQFAGATITPRKVVQAIRRGLEFYRTHRQELIDAAETGRPAS